MNDVNIDRTISVMQHSSPFEVTYSTCHINTKCYSVHAYFKDPCRQYLEVEAVLRAVWNVVDRDVVEQLALLGVHFVVHVATSSQVIAHFHALFH